MPLTCDTELHGDQTGTKTAKTWLLEVLMIFVAREVEFVSCYIPPMSESCRRRLILRDESRLGGSVCVVEDRSQPLDIVALTDMIQHLSGQVVEHLRSN